MTVMKLSTGKVIGGYLGESWGGAGWVTSTTAFLFSLSTNFKHTLRWGSATFAAYSTSSSGPSFGGGVDLKILSDLNSGSCTLGTSYACRVGDFSQDSCKDDFCGSKDGWSVEELEVYVQEQEIAMLQARHKKSKPWDIYGQEIHELQDTIKNIQAEQAKSAETKKEKVMPGANL